MSDIISHSVMGVKLELIDTPPIKQEPGDEINNVKSLRNFKLRVPALFKEKSNYIDPNIKKEAPDYNVFSDSTDTDMGYLAPDANVVTDAANIKTESAQLSEERQESNNIMYDLPLKCILEEQLVCPYCPCTNSCEQEFQKHIDIHYMEKPFSCELCSFITKYRGCLKTHMHTHIKIERVKRFACEYCSFKTSYKFNLKSHLRVHTDDKQFNCEFCSYKTNFKKHYQLHVLSHTGLKSFYCELCPYKTHKKGDFRVHISTHTEPFKCQLCLYKADSESLLSSHMVNCCVLIRQKSDN